jgi:hypothetical protein
MEQIRNTVLRLRKTVLGISFATMLHKRNQLALATDFMKSEISFHDACEFRVFWHEVQPFITSVSWLYCNCPRVEPFIKYDDPYHKEDYPKLR